MSVTLMRQHVASCLDSAQMLRVFRRRPGLFGLIGAWHDSRTVVGFDPVRRLPRDADPFAAVSDQARPAGQEGFGGGWVGAFGYQLGGRLETLPPSPPRPVPLPPFDLAYYDHVLVSDAANDGWWFEALVHDGNRERVQAQLGLVNRLLREPVALASSYTCTEFVARPAADGHRAAVRATLRHLVAGDIYQANVCRRFDAGFAGDSLDLFCAGVERLAPSYAAFIRTAEGAIASFSPELFLRRSGRHVRTSPIKGTAPLASGVDRLEASAKDRAENVMIVDLMRNDLGRVCVPGSVHVQEIARAERRTGVWHLVSDVVGTLAADEDDTSLLRATFPPGSVTGAPKVRAMEVIHEVEHTARETYTGAVGYVSPGAGLELNVAIRTFEFAGDRVWFGAGGGVVIGSTPQGELVETLVKTAPLLDAIGARLCREEERILSAAAAAVDGTGESTRPDAQRDPLPPVDPDEGLFTTCLVDGGTTVDLDRHLARLAASVADCYGGELPGDLSRHATALAEPLEGRHRLRIRIVPGADGSHRAELEATPLAGSRGDPLRLVPVVVRGGLGPHKFHDRRRLESVEPAAGVWSAACDALVTDHDGSLLETGRGNLFVVTDEGVHTPPLDGRQLPGITRSRAIEALEAAGVSVVQRQLTLGDVATAAEVFATSSLDVVRPVTSVDRVGRWRVGPTTRWLAGRLRGRPAAEPAPPSSIGFARGSATVLLVDNYDSFVYNLDQYVRELGARTLVVRNDALDVDEVTRAVAESRLDGIIISPGPGRPPDAGASKALIERLGSRLPILGICLGHQCIAEVYGAHVVPAGTVVHGRPALVHHDGAGVFTGLDGPLVAGRYHSLVVSDEGLSPDLMVTARTAGGVVMGLRHREYDVEGLQFHPESILSRQGHHLLDNFLRACSRQAVTLARDGSAGRSGPESLPVAIRAADEPGQRLRMLRST